MLRLKTFVNRFVKNLPDCNKKRSSDNPYFVIEFWDVERARYTFQIKVTGFGPRENSLQYHRNNDFLYNDNWQITEVGNGSCTTGRQVTLRIKRV